MKILFFTFLIVALCKNGTEIASTDFSGQILKGKDFSGLTIFDVKFIGADLSGANFTQEMV